MKNVPLLLTLILTAGFASLNAQLLSESFDSESSLETWVGGPAWSATDGNPDGAVIVSNNVQPSNKNYSIDVPLALSEATDLTVSFDAKSLVNMSGVLHFYVEPEGMPQFSKNFNMEFEINDSTFTQIVIEVADVPASASFVTLRFEMITGAVQGADISVVVDNLMLVGPTVDPEGTWKGYVKEIDGWVNMGGSMGFVYVESDPWLFSADLEGWFYLPEGDAPDGNAPAWIQVVDFWQ